MFSSVRLCEDGCKLLALVLKTSQREKEVLHMPPDVCLPHYNMPPGLHGFHLFLFKYLPGVITVQAEAVQT